MEKNVNKEVKRATSFNQSGKDKKGNGWGKKPIAGFTNATAGGNSEMVKPKIPAANLNAAKKPKMPNTDTYSLMAGYRYYLRDFEKFNRESRAIHLADITRSPKSLDTIPAEVQNGPLYVVRRGNRFTVISGHLSVEKAHDYWKTSEYTYSDLITMNCTILAKEVTDTQLKTIEVFDPEAHKRWVAKNKKLEGKEIQKSVDRLKNRFGK